MGETEGEITATDSRASEEPEAAPVQDTLQVPAQKRRKLKSPTPGSMRGRSATPIRGRSQTPVTLYMTRRSATPSTWRSITPFLHREEKEKTPFELGRDLKTLLTCNTAVFDRALVMDISEPLDAQKPVRYITSDLSVIDRAAVMDVSNVEVIYVVEEYEEYEEEEEIVEEVVKPKKKSRGPKKERKGRRSVDKEGSIEPGGSEGEGEGGDGQNDREESVDLDDGDEPVKKGKKKAAPRKKEKKEKSPSPKLTLKLEIGGGQKGNKKMFEEKQQQQAGPGPKPPPKKSKLALQMEEQAKAAAKAAEEEAAKLAAKKPVETFEERQKRLKAEQEEREREEAERRAEEEALAAEEAGEEEDYGDYGDDGDEGSSRYDDGGSRYDEDGGESRYDEDNADEELDEVGELPAETRRSSASSEGFTRPDPDDVERWNKIKEEEGEEFMQQLRKYSVAVRTSEKQRDEEWQRRRDQRRMPHFVVFLSDRTVEAGNNVRLACAVGGPELSVKWFKDGRQLERDATHRIINNNNILALEVVNTTILDSGEYSCVIANMNDEVRASCYVTIYEVFKDQPAPPSFRLVREYYHLRDDELTIETHIHGIPRPVVTWWRGAFEIKPNVKFSTLEEAHGVYKLLIYKPNNRDAGIYTCKAINSSGEAQVNHTVEVGKNLHYHVPGIFHARDRLKRDKEQTAKKAMEDALKSKDESDKRRAEAEVRARAPRSTPEPLVSAKQKLKFATQLRDRMTLEGTTAKLVVTVIGPDPACRWMKDDKWVTYNENIKNHSEDGKAIIELKNVTSESSGVYKCVAKNDYSEIETSCYFKVYSAQADGDEHEPIFALPLRDVYHASQNDLILDTKIRGNPRPQITWIKDQIPIVLDDRIVQIEHLDGICELIINKPTTNDSGKYTCIAKNKLGSQETSHTVVVDVHQVSRRSSILSSIMSESESVSKKGGAGGDKEHRPPKSKKKNDEGDGTYERRSRLPDPSPRQQLYFTAYLSNRFVAVGSKVKLQAVINGPDPTIKWLKDDQNVTFGPRIRNMNREGMACLEFTNCQPEDSGVYSVLAQNEFCKINSSCQLHVYSPDVSNDVEPVFVRPIKDTYHLILNELTLETGVRGTPTPQVQWLKDNIDIENAGRFHIFQNVDGTCALVIDNPSDKDSGKYIVRAENGAGKSEVIHNVLFKGKEHHIADNIHGVFHADKSLLKPKHVEEEKPKLAPASEVSDTESKGSKRVRKPKKDDDEAADASSASAYAAETASETSSLKKREKVIGIHFATAVRDRVVAEGSKLKITCFLEAKEPQVKWFKNNEQIQNSPKMRARYVEGLCSLEITSAALEDCGEYKCWAKDETGEASTFCNLEVYSDPGTGDVPPTFTRNIKDTYHGKIHEVQLDCHVRGLPTPTITWVKDGVKIEPSDKYQQVEHDDGTIELFIMDPTANDSGKYVCQAENREGKAEIVHMVTVHPRRRRPVSPSKDRPPALPPTEETDEEKEKKRKKKKQDDEEGGGRRREVAPPPDLRKRLYFRNFLSNRTVLEGSNVKWMVNIDGPEPTARWFHDEQPIAFGPKSKLSMQDGIAWLNLIGVTEEDGGEYTLRVKGPENEIVSTCNLFVYTTGKEELIPPTFTVGIKDVYHSHENHITLECKVSGNPKPNVYWQKDNVLLPGSSTKFKLVELQDSVIQLIINNPEKEDTGLYTCYADSESGQMKISKFVDVTDYVKKISERNFSKSHIQAVKDEVDTERREEQKLRSKDAKFKLNIETPMKPMIMASGSKAQMICYVTGFIEDVYWLRGEERVTKDSRHKIYNINGALSLEIYDARPDDTGEYKCVIRNSRNSTDCKCDLMIYDNTTSELPSSFSSNVTAIYDAERCEITLSCVVHGRPSVTWIRDDHTISNNRYRIVEEIGGVRKLIIRNPIPADCGTFSCFAETNERIESITKVIKIADLKNLMTAAAETATNGFSHTTEDPKCVLEINNAVESISCKSVGRSISTQRKPLFSTLLNDRTVTEFSNVRLMCTVVFGDCTKIEWLKGNQPLPKDNRYQTIFHNGEAILEISAAQEHDSGHYTCVATNDYGETVSRCQLRIYKHFEDALQPASFVQSIKDTYSLNDNELVLDCRVRGKPRPEVQWVKGTEPIIPGEKYIQVDQDDGHSKLIINNPTEKDSGLYSCVARNEAAENKITHQVDFRGREHFTLEKTHGFFHRNPNKPHFIAPLGNQTVCNGGTIAISAEFMQTNTPIEVQWFRNRKSLVGQPGVKTFYERGVYTLTIMNAQPENEGTYTCRAQNAFGRIESTGNVDVAVGAPKEERPPLFLSRPDTEMKIAVGDPFSISFRIAGDPKPRLTFMKGLKDLTKSDRVSKEVSDDYTRFSVQNSQISDSGTYFVVARNSNGTDRIFVTVEVMSRARSETPSAPRWGLPLDSFPNVSYFKDPPAAISTEPLLIDSGPTHISLSWGKPPSNNSAPVIAYRVDAWIVGHEGGAMWKELGLTPINSFDAFNLKSNYEYHFRITPKNRYGWGPSVQTSAPMQVGGVECLPEFTKILPGQVKALLNKEFVLETMLRGSPRPDIVWYKDGLRISSNIENERIKTRKIGFTCTLTIKQVTESDAGRYTCEATNSKGRVSTFARLQVVSDPKLYEADNKLKEIVRNENLSTSGDTLPIFTMRLRDRRVQVTYPVRLTCQVVGNPQPEISWYKDDDIIETSRRCLFSEDNQFYTLELSSATLSDSGVYTCTAKNELGSVSCHCSLVVDKGIRAYISPEFCMPLDPLYIFQEGQELRLTAKVEAYPAVGVSWHRNGVKLRPSRRLAASLDTNGFVELIISEANIRDAGIYTCVASNAVGKQESLCRVCIESLEEDNISLQQQSSKNIPAIRTNDMPYSQEPLFVVKPRSSEAYEGDTVIIFCEVVGDPKPEVVWLRDFLNPEYYKDAPHFRRIGDGPEYRLEIPYAKLDFTGTYSVIATNCHGETKAVISLQIFAKDILKQAQMEKGSIRHGNVETLPRFIRHLRNLRCCDGDAITLEAHVEGLPEPIIIWEKDGRVLPSGKDFDMTYDGIKATLSIPRVYPEDEGEYTCVAKNNIGRTLCSACIIVDVPEEKENMLNRQLSRPTMLLSTTSTPLSTPRSTPNRSFSPARKLSYRNSIIDISDNRNRGSHDAHQVISAPKFLAIPNSRVVEEGDSVRFQCAIAGHPMPWSTWDKDGLIVTPTTRIAIKEVNDLRYLEIDEVSFDDAGLYRITLENDYGRIEATARLDVINSSRYSKSPSGRSIRASSSKRNAYIHRRIMGPSTAIGGRMALATGFRGSSVPSCKFYHNGVEVRETERVDIDFTQEDAFIIVDNVTKEDEGIYTCVIEGPDHEPIATSTFVKFLPKDLEDQPLQTTCKIIQSLPDKMDCMEGQAIDLCFELDTNMPYTYIWSRNGEPIKDSEDFNFIDHGNGILCLRIHDAFDLDSACYACNVTTIDGFQCSTFTNLNIERNSEISNDSCLAIMKSPLPVVADCGVKATFYARVFPSDAQVSWLVCGRKVNDDNNAESSEFTLEASTDGVRILHINNVTLAHSGEVQLFVTHPAKPYSTLKSYTSLAVIPRSVKNIESSIINNKSDLQTQHKSKDRLQQPAYILEGPNDCTALIGGCVRLTIIFEGLPKPQVTWFKASRPIIETSNIIINTSSRKSVLQISDIVTDDSGKYTVEVMNEFGSDAAVASVAVEGPPEPPSGKPSISQGPDRVAIAWCGPPYDGGCMITGFIIEMQQFESSQENETEAVWLEIANIVDSLAYTVKDLKPLSTYRFRVRAENIHGRSEPSLPSDHVYIAEEFEDLTEDFQKPMSIKSGGDFKDRFDILEELGKGRFGVVYKVQEREEAKRICAAKIIKCIKSKDRVKVQEEILIMKSLKHPKLLQLAASFESSREIVMVMEFITGGELFERVVADDFTLTERDCILFVRQVCEGVAYMHSQSIVHLDLKPENIMCKTRTCHQIKIIDFGLAQRLNTGSPVRVLFGTPEFIPPEIISYEPIGFQSDMWSVGVICYVLLSGLSPFMGDTDIETFSNITRADYDFDDDAFDCVSQQAKDFISNLLVHRKEDRLTAEQCSESPWLKQGHHDENLATKKICTDKLKKFIIRRKWQKTGNAIRALGRMATLSASRRNSAVSAAGSLPSSPRPSISGTTIFNPNISVQMGSLHEEDDDFSIEVPSSTIPRRKSPNVLNKSHCSERSDSGYSECSNCSASGTIQCQCPNHKDNTDHMVNEDLSISVLHDLLKLKLEEIAHQADSNIEETKLELVVPSGKRPEFDDNYKKLKNLELLDTEQKPIQVVEEIEVLSPSASPIMRSDFTNTIQMRKKSLENSLHKEKLKPSNKPPLYDKPGKVNMLKNKFLCMQSQVSTPSSNAKSKDCMEVLKLKHKVINDACPIKTSSATSSSSSLQTQLSTSLPNSPIPTRKTIACSTFRLSDRVREVTDRLAQQQTVCTEARKTQKSPPLNNRKKVISP